MDPISDHVLRALKRLVTQYRGKPRIEGIVSLYGVQIQELEDVFNDIDASLDIDANSGEQLDRIGQAIGISRFGVDDANYRLLIKVQAFALVSKGTPEEVIEIFRVLMATTDVAYLPLFPADFVLTASDPTPIISTDEIRQILFQILPVGIHASLISSPTDAFQFDDGDGSAANGPTDPLHGFSDVGAPTTGGEFSTII